MTTPVSTEHHVDESSLVRLVDSLPQLVWIECANGLTEHVNPAALAYTGRSFDGSAEWEWLSMLHPEDVAAARQVWGRAMMTQTSYDVDGRIRRADGDFTRHAIRGVPIRDDRGLVVRWIVTATDTDGRHGRVETSALVQRRTAEVTVLLDALETLAPVGFGFIDGDLRVVDLNDTLARYGGGSPVAAGIGQLAGEALPVIWDQLGPVVLRVLDTGTALLDARIDRTPSAAPASGPAYAASCHPVSHDGVVIGVVVTVADLGERPASDDDGRRLAAIVESSGDAIFGVSLTGVVTSWNAAAERLFGYLPEQIVGHSVGLLAPGGREVEQIDTRRRLVASPDSVDFDTVRRHQDGSLVDVHLRCSRVVDRAGEVVELSVIAHDIGDRRRAEEALQSSQRQLAAAQRIARLGSLEFTYATRELVCSDELYRILALRPERTLDAANFVAFVHPEDRLQVLRAWEDALERGASFDLSYRIIRADGVLRHVHARAVPELDPDGAVLGLSGTVRDTTEAVDAAKARRFAETRFETGFEQSAIGAAIVALDGSAIRVNDAVCAVLGRTREELLGRSWSQFVHPDETVFTPVLRQMLEQGKERHQAHRRYLRPDGTVVSALVNLTLVRDEDGAPQYYYSQLQDVSAQEQLERELEHRLLHDTLTGLPNRALLLDRLVHGLEAAVRRRSKLGVMVVNIDHLKMLNATLGNACGDELLARAAVRISDALRPGDTVARLGGDEFVVICDDVAAATIGLLAVQILESLRQPCRIGDEQVVASASIGIALADAESTPETLLGHADVAMQLAKERGRGRVELFDDALRAKSETRRTTTAEIQRALDRQEFVVHFQPIVDLTTGAMVSAEALVRWEHPERGLMSPVDFVGLAEESGLIVPIGAWVLDQACAELARWHRTDPSVSMAVNLSVRQLAEPDVVTVVTNTLKRHGIAPDKLSLELTESLFMEDRDYFGAKLACLKAAGVCLSIDDFGTGYSSLSYLKHFPVDTVKVDRVFVAGLGAEPHAQPLVSGIIAMAEAMDLGVTAEGVETAEQLACLRALRCERVQGYFLARPMPATELRDLMADGHRWATDSA